MNTWLLALGCVSVVSLVSLVGLATFSASEDAFQQVNMLMVSLAIGALLGDAFIHLIPEAFKHLGEGPRVPALILSGMGLFFLLEKFLHWQHDHTPSKDGYIHAVGPMNLLANSIHNFVDGVLIGVAFLSSSSIGFATTIAIVMHEIPHEFGNFAVLLHAGYTRRRALFFNFLVSGTAVAGTILALLIGSEATQFSLWMLPIASGGFIYIAGCDLVPQLHRETRPLQSVFQFLAIGLGVVMMFGMLALEKT